jgi:PBP1b-binding outer membrane lipoprotein LpoB
MTKTAIAALLTAITLLLSGCTPGALPGFSLGCGGPTTC